LAKLDLLRHRLYNQQLTRPQFETAAEVVAWLGAVQSQEYLGAIWSVGQRMISATDSALDRAFDDGAILRTHVMRPTWHFVAPADLRWLLALTAPRVHRLNDLYYRRAELDAAILKRCDTVLAKALRGGQHLTREELQARLQQAGVERDRLGVTYIMMHAELEGLICSGPRRGKQFTYALLEERVPPSPALSRDEALAELVRRYFTSHGPAQAQDFAWWSGLTVADTKAGLAMVKGTLENERVDGLEYWFAPGKAPPLSVRAYLLPTYDEYGIAYKDRHAFYNPADAGRTEAGYRGGFPNLLVLGGQVIGLWGRELSKSAVTVTLQLWRAVSDAEQRQIAAAAQRYADFLGQRLVLA
jgi:hypothetical protein